MFSCEKVVLSQFISLNTDRRIDLVGKMHNKITSKGETSGPKTEQAVIERWKQRFDEHLKNDVESTKIK